MKKITVREIMKFGPCDRYNVFTVFKLIKFGKTPLEILDLPISKNDKFWLLLRSEYIPERQLHLLACNFAQEVAYLNPDPSVQAAIDAKRMWVDNRITDEALKKARDAAYAAYAAASSAASAAYAAAYAAACAAASAAYAAAYAVYAATYAAWSADVDINIGTKQIEMVRKVFIDMEEVK